MYNWFYIEKNIWNNAFSFDKRKNKKIWVPSLKKINSSDEIKIWEKIAFEDYDFDWNLSTNYGLENFYEIEKPPLNPLLSKEGKEVENFRGGAKKIYIFDNHNHALYFWLLERNNWFLWDNNTLYHIDEHADYRDPWEYLLKPDSLNNKKVFEYVNFSKINVGNYIISAEKEGVIKETIQLRSSLALEKFLEKSLTPPPSGTPLEKGRWNGWIILNLDLDFFCENLDFIDFELKKKTVKKIFDKASLVTISTSPFFINQELALQRLKDLEIL